MNINSLAHPTTEQLAWADAEIGVIIHLDMQVFEPDYEFRKAWGYTPDLKVFNPDNLDTDQWISTAKSAGAKYAVLVAKHCSGFSLWPTQAHDYHIGNTPWKDGKGDIVGDFFRSCKKYGLKPGLYCSASCNGYLLADNPGKILTDDHEFLKKYSSSMEMQSGRQSVWASDEKQVEYNRIVETQLTELWTNYGRLFEIWFDGGVVPHEEGGPDVVGLMKKLQPEAVVFGGPSGWPSLVRFVGNERAEPEDPFWSTTDDLSAFDGTTEVAGLGGNPDGAAWSPGEADMPNRDQHKAFQGGWFWHKGDEKHLYSVDHLMECYLRSVGKNTNLLLGMVIDNRGMVPEEDQAQFAEFGNRVQQMFSNPVQASVAEAEQEKTFYLKAIEPREFNMIVLQEDIKHGERVRKYVVEAKQEDGWLTLCRGTVIGHKRIERFASITTSEIRLKILESADQPKIRDISAWNADPSLFGSPMDPVLSDEPIISRDKNNMVHIRCSNPNILIRYSTDGTEPNSSSPVFEKPFALMGKGVIKAYSFVNDLSHSRTVTAHFGVDRSKWEIEYVSMESPFKNGGYADSAHLLNDDPKYYWHTYHSNTDKSKPPHEVIINMNEALAIEAFTVTLTTVEGCPDDCEFLISDDGEKWHSAVKATFSNVKKFPCQQIVKLDKPLHGRFIRLIIKTALNNKNYIKLAGIGV